MSDELCKSILETLSQSDNTGFGGIVVKLLNEVMKYERSEALHAQPYERNDSRLGHANGFKNKTMRTTMGALDFDIPQVRGDLDFYPSALEKGLRSERAMKIAMAEMYIHTRCIHEESFGYFRGNVRS